MEQQSIGVGLLLVEKATDLWHRLLDRGWLLGAFLVLFLATVLGIWIWRSLNGPGWPWPSVWKCLTNPKRGFVAVTIPLGFLFIAAITLPPLARVIWGGVCSSSGGTVVTSSVIEDVSKLLFVLAGILGVPFLVWRIWILDQQKRIADQQQKTGQETYYTNFLKNAIDQLGALRGDNEPNIEHRIAAIWALEKLARDYEQLHWPVMEILCSYIRGRVGIPTGSGGGSGTPQVDVQTALTVIGRRSKDQRNWEIQRREKTGRKERLDLSNCDLSGAQMPAHHFERANFRGSLFLSQANLNGAYLNGVDMSEARLEGADLNEADLEDAQFISAHLEQAQLNAQLQGTILNDAHLEGAFLTTAKGLTLDQLAQAWGDKDTNLPSGLRPRNKRWAEPESTPDG
jgi:uncharacterized protein YjbI with pentapeptide repeats